MANAENLWKTYGKSMEDLFDVYGKHGKSLKNMGHLWKHRKPMENL